MIDLGIQYLPTYNLTKWGTLQFAKKGDAAFDFRAVEETGVSFDCITVVATGVKFEIPTGYYLQISPRSGLAAKHGLTIINSPGIVDQGFKGEIQIILTNVSQSTYYIERGERIAQAILRKCVEVNLKTIASVNIVHNRGGGLGSTGKI